VVVVGDVNSTLACALTAHKMQTQVAHVEAGLRSYDKNMPEEANRVLTDHISDFLFAPSEDAYQNLLREGIDKKKIFIVGNVMIDTLKANWVKAEYRAILKDLGLENSHKIEPYVVLTLHRPSNVDNPKVLRGIVKALNRISRKLPVLYPAHPRTWANIKEFGLDKYFTNIQSASGLKLQSLNCSQYGLYAMEPLRYLDFIKVQMHATAVLTDSGGVQEETAFLGVPCLTLRENTERPVTVALGTNKVIGVDKGPILQAWEEIEETKDKDIEYKKGAVLKRGRCKIPKWDGKAAERIVRILTG
jgi:UDP-N-acetylglucosamine 2-epimerase (non-hydrolysing)